MNKKILGGLIVMTIIGVCAFVLLDRKSEEEKMLDAISWFIYEQTGEFEEYQALEFIEITNEMLLGDVVLKEQLAVVKDTLKQKSNFLRAYDKLPKSWNEELHQFEELQPDQMDEYLKMNSKLNMALNNLEDHETVEKILKKESMALEIIEAKLQALNLSIYSIDLSANQSIHYLHKFALDGVEQLSVFEIDTQSQEVISYKRIG